jgi:hypothetical protein
MTSRYVVRANQGVFVSKDGKVKMLYIMTYGNTKIDFYVNDSVLMRSILLDSDLFNMFYDDIREGVENRTYEEIVPWTQDIEFYIKLHRFCMYRRLPKFDCRSFLRSNVKQDKLQTELLMAFVRVYAVSSTVGLQNILKCLCKMKR